MTSLAQAVANAYEVFAAYGFGRLEWASPDDCNADYSDLASENSDLTGRALHKLTAQDLSSYYHEAISIVGSVTDFKHFLPRILELLASDSRSGFHPKVLVMNLEAASFPRWPDRERRAVLGVLRESGHRGLAQAAASLAALEGRESVT